MLEGWSLAVVAGLGAYHGLNPAMGWLFAVGLGLQERSRGAVLRALGPIAIGHELAVVLVAAIVLVAGTVVDTRPLHLVAAAAPALCCRGGGASGTPARGPWGPCWGPPRG